MPVKQLLTGDTVDMSAFAYMGVPPRAHGWLRVEPGDFRVEEIQDVPLDGAGEHLWLQIEKIGWTTPQVVEHLAAYLGMAPKHISYSGLKDRHAVTTQWLSLHWPIKAALPVWPEHVGYRVLMARRHGRKLRRGTHRANRFAIRVRNIEDLDISSLEQRVASARQYGVPNYFGPQRFGRGGRNMALARALFAGRRLSRGRRSFALSATRSLLFNAVLDARLRYHDWPAAVPGDVFMLAGTHSLFASATTQQDWASLQDRCRRQDILPTGPLPGRQGRADLVPVDQAGELENRVLAAGSEWVEGLKRFAVDADRRSLCLPVPDLSLDREGSRDIRLCFSLPTGAFATSVLRELVQTTDATAVAPDHLSV